MKKLTQLNSGLIRTKDVQKQLSRTSLANLVRRGKLERLERGIYCTPDYTPAEIFEIERLLKHGTKFVVALQSALQIHGFTTARPSALEIALPLGGRVPKVNFPLQAVHLSNASWEHGQQQLFYNGIEVPIFTPAKTVADLFKFRNRLGTDLAIEGLREGIRGKFFTPNEFLEAAKANRVFSIVQPYLESVF